MSISEVRKSGCEFSLLTFDFDHPPTPSPNIFLTEWKTGTKFSCQIMDEEKKTRGKIFSFNAAINWSSQWSETVCFVFYF